MSSDSFFQRANLQYFEEMYENYKQDPKSVDDSLRHFFTGFDMARTTINVDVKSGAVSRKVPQEFLYDMEHSFVEGTQANGGDTQERVYELISAYRKYGHLQARINPLDTPVASRFLSMEEHGLNESHLNLDFHAGNLPGSERKSLKHIIEQCDEAYCSSLAVEYVGIVKDVDEYRWLQKEVEIVGEIKKSLLSQNKEEDFPISGINIPAKVVSGDFYNFSDLGDGKYGFGVADVSGKGIKSSLLMSKASSLYRCLSKTNFSAADLLIQLNNEICETISRGMFVTMLVGIYDSNKKELLLSSAGHEPPIIFSKDGIFTNYNEAGPPLGIMPNTKYQEHTISFVNSSMYIFTDGITEIKNPNGEMLGSEGFQNYIKQYQSTPTNERLKIMIDDILNKGHIQKDDLTIVVIDSK